MQEYSRAHRNPAFLVAGEFEDRRRIAQTELIMRFEEAATLGQAPTALDFGQTMLKHSLEDDLEDVAKMGDKVRRRLHI